MDKLKETLAQIVETTPMFHMLRINIGHNGNGCGQTVERAIAFIGLNNHPFALPSAGIGFKRINHAAIDHSRIKSTRMQEG